MVRFLLKKKEEILNEYILKRKTKISVGNRKENDIVVNDMSVSDYHCTILLRNGKCFIRDQKTITGTKVNGKRIVAEKELEDGDIIGIGQHIILYLDRNSLKDEKNRYLLGIYGKFIGKKYSIKNTDTFIGREQFSPKGIENDIVLADDMTVSKEHVRISLKADQYIITDVGSAGGVTVNGVKVGQLDSMAITLGDEISIGRTVFRFSNSRKENYSIPKKQRVFLLTVLKILSVCVILASLTIAVFAGFRLSTLTRHNHNLSLELNHNFKKDITLRHFYDYDIISTPAIGDISGNKKNDIVMLTATGFLYCWEFKTGKNLWDPIEIINSNITSPMLADMNNNGIKDIVVLSDASMLFIYDGQTGYLIRKETMGGMISELTPLVADLTENGKMDVVVCSQDGRVNFLYNAGYRKDFEKHTEFVEGPLYASPVLYKSKTIGPMVVVANNKGKVYLIDGKTRTKKVIDLVEKTGKAHPISGTPAIGDLNDDGIPEIVVQTNVPQYISAIDIVNSSVLWTFYVDPQPPQGLKHNASPLIENGDVFVVSANGTIYNLKGKTGYSAGELLWELKLPGVNRMIASPAKYDFDKDGYCDFVIATEDGKIMVVKNNIELKKFEILAEIQASNMPITSSPLIADVFGTGKLNILFVDFHNTLQIINTNANTIKNSDIWPMFLGGPSHTGSNKVDIYKTEYYKIFFSGTFVFVLLVILKIINIVKRNSKKVKIKFL